MTAATLSQQTRCLPHPRPLAALALHNLVAFLEQALPFTGFACLLLLYVRAFFIGHRVLQRWGVFDIAILHLRRPIRNNSGRIRESIEVQIIDRLRKWFAKAQ